MKHNHNVIRSALAGVFALTTIVNAAPVLAGEHDGDEKCAGVIKAGQNDCTTSMNACHGHVTVDKDPMAWIWVPKSFDDPRKELHFSGVFRWHEGKLELLSLELLSSDLEGPNGLTFSPDEKYLYVSDWDPKRKIVMRYEVRPDGSLGSGEAFFDMTTAPGEDALDGLKVDRQGNLYVAGPGGLWILSAEGKHLGTIIPPKHPHNFAWGDEDGKTLYMTSRTGLYRMRFDVPGIRP